MHRHHQWLKVECPTCHSLPGENCFKVSYYTVHETRLRLAQTKLGTIMPSKNCKTVYFNGRYATGACKADNHKLCTGFNKKMNKDCTCSCHKKPLIKLDPNL